MNIKDKLVFRDMLQKPNYYNHKPFKGRISGCDRYNQNNLDKDVRSFLKLDTKLDGRGFEKNIILSNIIEIYKRLQI